jgi:photosystem II stability/assembly factor-like uncharacterized protein
MQRFWIALATLLVLGVLAISFLHHPRTRSHGKFETEEATSGALEALNLWAAERAYPNPVIPDVGQAAAFAEMQFSRVQSVAGADPIDHLVGPWTSLGPNNIGGRTLALALLPGNPDVMFAGSANGGLWKSITGGVGADAWDYVETGFPVSAVSTIAIDPRNPSVMYIGTGEVYRYQNSIGGDVERTTRGSYGIGILKSTDGGATWSKSLDWSLNQTRGVWSIRIHPANSNIVYAATTEGVYKSLNAGATWTLSLNVLMATDLRIHPTAPETVLVACGNFGSAGTGLYRTLNGGTSWTKLTTGLPASWTGKALIDISPVNPAWVYASIANSGAGVGLYRSINTGVNWTLMNATDYPTYQGWYAHWVLCSLNNVNTLYVGGIDIWKSTNAGTTLSQVSDWTQIYLGTPLPGQPGGGPLYAHADQHFAVRHPTDPNTFFVVSDGGVFKTTDGGASYTGLNGGYVTTQFYQGFTNSKLTANYAIGGMQDNLTAIYHGTTAWERVIGGDGCWTAIHPANDLTLYGAAQYLDIYRSYDGGQNWTSIAPPNPGGAITGFVAPYVLCPSSPSRLYAGRNLVYRSDSEGTVWAAANNGAALDGVNPAFSMAVSATNADLIFVATAPNGTRGHLYKSLNGGTSWTDVTGTLPDRYLSDITLDPTNDNRLYVAVMGFGSSHLFRSDNQGGAWIDVGTGLPDVPASAVEVDPQHPSNVYVGTDLGVYVSVDQGQDWHPFMTGMPTASVNDLKVSGPSRKIRAATHGNGVYERDLLDMTFTGIPDVHPPARLQLAVSPNPLQTGSTIRFALQEPGPVRLSLYDVSGREVTRILDEERGAGEQELSFPGLPIARGIYFLKLESRDGTAITRVVRTR